MLDSHDCRFVFIFFCVRVDLFIHMQVDLIDLNIILKYSTVKSFYFLYECKNLILNINKSNGNHFNEFLR